MMGGWLLENALRVCGWLLKMQILAKGQKLLGFSFSLMHEQ